MTQKENVLEHLQSGKTITPLEALKLYGSFRLGSIIFKLRMEGHNIKTTPTKYKKKYFASYSLDK